MAQPSSGLGKGITRPGVGEAERAPALPAVAPVANAAARAITAGKVKSVKLKVKMQKGKK